jgi:hypothetical protein
MSYTTIYFLTKEDNFNEAEKEVSAYLEAESFFDYYNISSEISGSLETKRRELLDLNESWDWKERAKNYLNEAEKYKEDKSSLFGTYLINAGVLYSQSLTIDTRIYNIHSGDYSIPDEDKNWWAVAVEFRY